jgi:hypothetical protein
LDRTAVSFVALAMACESFFSWLPVQGGNVSDSGYNCNAGYLEEQAAFQQMICAMENFCDLQLYTTKDIKLRQFAGSIVNLLRSLSLGGVTNASLSVIQFTQQ